jgi:spore coat polysaccharide biosynthesis protein SpsF
LKNIDRWMSMSNIVAIVQARMSSKRLPGKVLLELCGQPMLVRVVERTRRATLVNRVVVATTSDPSDDAIQALCDDHGYPCYRGSMFDVLDRYYQAACIYHAEVIVRITADCPLIDPQVVDHTIRQFLESGVDFAANRLPPPWKRTFPIGLDTEVCTFDALARAWREAHLPRHREHVMPYLYEEEGRFRSLVIHHEPDYGHLRWTVDTAEDLEFVRRIYAHFNGRDDFSWLEVLALIEQHPELSQINAHVKHKTYQDTELNNDIGI